MNKSTYINIIKIVLASLIACFFSIMLLLVASTHSPVSCAALPDPKSTVDEFFSALCGGDYKKCDSLLANYSTLGLENELDATYEQELFELLKESYSYELIGEAKVDALEAYQRVKITFLSMELLKEDLGRNAYSLADLTTIKNTQDNAEIQNAIDNALKSALDIAKGNIEQYYVTKEITVTLKYTSGVWYIYLDNELYDTILGISAVSDPTEE